MSEPIRRSGAHAARSRPSSPAAGSAPAAGTTGHGKAGRDLPLAIGVGVGLGGLCLVSLLTVQWGWLLVATPCLVIGVWELCQGMAAGKIDVPVLPAAVGTAVMIPGAYLGGPVALMVAFGLTVLAMVGWRTTMGAVSASRDIAGGAFVVAYGPFLASFSALMLAQDDGPRRVIAFVLVTVCSDIGGYAAGVLAGRHPMAPSVSPKKSWEGFAGSATACVVGGALTVSLLLHGAWWAGAIVGLVVVVVATLGDLTESMLKRDLGIKDLGRILPGHGGLMDRLDSLLLTAPAVWFLLLVLVPVA